MHSFVISIEGDEVIEKAHRASDAHPTVGRILEASYLAGETPRPKDLFSSFMRFIAGDDEIRFRHPFDEDGRDALGLFRVYEPEVVSIAGTVVSLHEANRIVVRDLWLEKHRVVEADDFLVQGDGDMALVACGMAPLVIAKPEARTLEPFSGRTCALLSDDVPPDARGIGFEIAAGDYVEVRGLARSLDASSRVIDLSEWGTGYRVAPRRPDRVIGDEDGMRLIVRKTI